MKTPHGESLLAGLFKMNRQEVKRRRQPFEETTPQKRQQIDAKASLSDNLPPNYKQPRRS